LNGIAAFSAAHASSTLQEWKRRSIVVLEAKLGLSEMDSIAGRQTQKLII
jgi:hypothetical protein